VYEAFGDYNTMRDLTESLLRACAREVALQQLASTPLAVKAPGEPLAPEDLRLPLGDLTIDWGRPFEVVRYAELFEKGLGFSMNDRERVLKAAQERGIHTKNKAGVALDHLLLVNELFDDAEAALDPSRPTFVLDYPAPLCPLTRPKKSDPAFAERFELFVGGMELANAYTELNDPDIQEQRFREQLTGIDDNESTFRTFDEDVVRALKVGMPPAGGMGIGIDRLCMAILNQRTIRDVVLFPMMKPEAGE
jgi:lysyl-tRNA synthetase class 2